MCLNHTPLFAIVLKYCCQPKWDSSAIGQAPQRLIVDPSHIAGSKRLWLAFLHWQTPTRAPGGRPCLKDLIAATPPFRRVGADDQRAGVAREQLIEKNGIALGRGRIIAFEQGLEFRSRLHW